MLLGSPPNLAVDHTVGTQILDELAGDASEPFLSLHNAGGDVESLQVLHERPGVGLVCEPRTELRGIRSRNLHADIGREFDDGLRSQSAVEVIVERDLGQRGDTRPTSGHDEVVMRGVHRDNLSLPRWALASKRAYQDHP